MDLLAIRLGSEGGVNVVEPGSVLGPWRRAAGPNGQEITPEAALAIARGNGAGRMIRGAVVGVTGHLTLTGSLVTTSDNRAIAGGSVEGPADSLPELVSRLAARLLSEEAGVRTSESRTSRHGSLPAIRAYSAGRAALRSGHWDEAFRQFYHATVLDSTFALAALEVVHAAFYDASKGESPEVTRAKRLARAGRERLNPGDQALLNIWGAPFATAPQLFQNWQVAATKNPDRAEIWYGLGDAYYHDGMYAGLVDPLRLTTGAFQRGWALDSMSGAIPIGTERSPALTHLVETPR